jgi:hypothetical protein
VKGTDKQYLGDGVFVETVEDGVVRLTTEDGIATSNTIYLAPELWEALKLYMEQTGRL